MLSEKDRALLGDREAQEAITARGELLPCPFCGGAAVKRGFTTRGAKWVSCADCICDGETGMTPKEAVRNWNHRQTLLTPTQMAVLEKLEENHD